MLGNERESIYESQFLVALSPDPPAGGQRMEPVTETVKPRHFSSSPG